MKVSAGSSQLYPWEKSKLSITDFHIIRDHKKQNAFILLTWRLGLLQASLPVYRDLILAHSWQHKWHRAGRCFSAIFSKAGSESQNFAHLSVIWQPHISLSRNTELAWIFTYFHGLHTFFSRVLLTKKLHYCRYAFVKSAKRQCACVIFTVL